MNYDKEKYKVWNWKHPVVLHWIINPGLVINDLILGQTLPKIILIEKFGNKPFFERSIIPCPHCNTLHPGIKYSRQNNTILKNWFGYYCNNCNKIIPVHRNLTSLIILVVTYPIWIWFKKPLKIKWLEKQPERFQDLRLQVDNSKNTTRNWLKLGLIFGILMYLWMTFLMPFLFDSQITKEFILASIPVWLVTGLIFGLSMKLWMNKKGK